MSRSGSPRPDLASLLTILGDAISREVVGALEGTGLRHGHGYVIQRLLVAPATATEIAGELNITQQAVSKALKELVGLGHVEMTSDPADARRRPARLTPHGRAAVARARRARRRLDDRVRARLGPERLDAVTAELEEILDALGILDDVRRRSVMPPTHDLT